MGNQQGKEARSPPAQSGGGGQGSSSPGFFSASHQQQQQQQRTQGGGQQHQPSSARSRNRLSRPVSMFGLGTTGSSQTQVDPQPRPDRRTRREREEKKAEQEQLQRLIDRERSIREEHVDGGYLVTLGTYTGPEDFNKPAVRQLQIERRLAPFWKGLDDVPASWTDEQLMEAVRGSPNPPTNVTPSTHNRPPAAPHSNSDSAPNPNALTVPGVARTLSSESDHTTSDPASNLPSPTPSTATQGRSLPFRARGKTLKAALSLGPKNASQAEIIPREVALPHDPMVDGRSIEVALYRDSTDCPICFLSYPPYLNQTRCCDQPICSECFVQIKRPDPHYPEHHPDGPGQGSSSGATETPAAEGLISEPSTCPYCQQSELGVTYQPPPFRRGLVYSTSTGLPGSPGNPMSSQSSLNLTLSPTASPSPIVRRRTQSLSANAPNVITTDRIRPDWAMKLAAARATQARREAAATALHAAAFFMNTDQRGFGLRPGRFGRRSSSNAAAGPSVGPHTGVHSESTPETGTHDDDIGGGSGSGFGFFTSDRNHTQEVEDMMFFHAVRLSLAAEEERKKKEEKQAAKEMAKETKRKEKEERKVLKRQHKQGDVYGAGSVLAASLSSISLGLGRRRGNSVVGNSRLDSSQHATVANIQADAGSDEDQIAGGSQEPVGKGKGVDRGPSPEETGFSKSPEQTSISLSRSRHRSYTSTAASLAEEGPFNSYDHGDGLGSSSDSRASGTSFNSPNEEEGLNHDSDRKKDVKAYEERLVEQSVATLRPATPDGPRQEESLSENVRPSPTLLVTPESPIKSVDEERDKPIGNASVIERPAEYIHG